MHKMTSSGRGPWRRAINRSVIVDDRQSKQNSPFPRALDYSHDTLHTLAARCITHGYHEVAGSILNGADASRV